MGSLAQRIERPDDQASRDEANLVDPDAHPWGRTARWPFARALGSLVRPLLDARLSSLERAVFDVVQQRQFGPCGAAAELGAVVSSRELAGILGYASHTRPAEALRYLVDRGIFARTRLRGTQFFRYYITEPRCWTPDPAREHRYGRKGQLAAPSREPRKAAPQEPPSNEETPQPVVLHFPPMTTSKGDSGPSEAGSGEAVHPRGCTARGRDPHPRIKTDPPIWASATWYVRRGSGRTFQVMRLADALVEILDQWPEDEGWDLASTRPAEIPAALALALSHEVQARWGSVWHPGCIRLALAQAVRDGARELRAALETALEEADHRSLLDEVRRRWSAARTGAEALIADAGKLSVDTALLRRLLLSTRQAVAEFEADGGLETAAVASLRRMEDTLPEVRGAVESQRKIATAHAELEALAQWEAKVMPHLPDDLLVIERRARELRSDGPPVQESDPGPEPPGLFGLERFQWRQRRTRYRLAVAEARRLQEAELEQLDQVLTSGRRLLRAGGVPRLGSPRCQSQLESVLRSARGRRKLLERIAGAAQASRPSLHSTSRAPRDASSVDISD